jgi:glycosyltransferase involved in cell wall biosynthesis
MNPSISVIIPALNEENNIEPTVQEVLATIDDRFGSYELLIFDDGSTDNTGTIADALAAKYRGVKVIHNEHNMGLGYNYRKGIELAQNDYVVMFPGDNELLGISMEEMLSLIGVADIVVPYTVNYWIRPRLRQLISKAFTSAMNLLFGLRLKYYNGTVIHKSEIIKAVPISTSGFAYQAEILTRLIRSGHSFVEVGMRLREREHGSSKAFKLKNIAGVLKTIVKLALEIYVKDRRKYSKVGRNVNPKQ